MMLLLKQRKAYNHTTLVVSGMDVDVLIGLQHPLLRPKKHILPYVQAPWVP